MIFQDLTLPGTNGAIFCQVNLWKKNIHWVGYNHTEKEKFLYDSKAKLCLQTLESIVKSRIIAFEKCNQIDSDKGKTLISLSRYINEMYQSDAYVIFKFICFRRNEFLAILPNKYNAMNYKVEQIIEFAQNITTLINEKASCQKQQ